LGVLEKKYFSRKENFSLKNREVFFFSHKKRALKMGRVSSLEVSGFFGFPNFSLKDFEKDFFPLNFLYFLSEKKTRKNFPKKRKKSTNFFC